MKFVPHKANTGNDFYLGQTPDLCTGPLQDHGQRRGQNARFFAYQSSIV